MRDNRHHRHARRVHHVRHGRDARPASDSAQDATARRLLAANPFAASTADPLQLLVAFAQDASSLAELKTLSALVSPLEQFAVAAQAAYFYCPDGILQSKAGKALLGGASTSVTTRNWATVLKLDALATECAD
jgi:uncharacterized protein (DUF1697 family)